MRIECSMNIEQINQIMVTTNLISTNFKIDELDACIKSVYDSPCSISADFGSLLIDLVQKQDKHLLFALSNTQLPPLRKIFIQGLYSLDRKENEIFLKFLSKTLPKQLQSLCLYNNSGSSWRKFEEYYPYMYNCLENVSKEVYLFGLRLSSQSLVRLFTVCHKIRRLSLVN